MYILNLFQMYILNLFQMHIFNLAQSEIIDFEKGHSFSKVKVPDFEPLEDVWIGIVTFQSKTSTLHQS